MPLTHTDFICNIIRCVKYNGIQGTLLLWLIFVSLNASFNAAGDLDLFEEMIHLRPCIPDGELQNEILNFNLDVFTTAAIRTPYEKAFIFYPGNSRAIRSFDK